MQTSIWVNQHLRGIGGFSNFTINRPPLDWVITLLQIPLPPHAPLPLDVDPMAQIEVYLHSLHGDVGLHLICSLSIFAGHEVISG